MSTKKARAVRVKGVVQGVFFRKYTEQKAVELGLVGFVMNEVDGSVYMELEGSENSLNAMQNWCHEGSPSSVVSDVEMHELEPRGFQRFQILR